MYRQWSIAVYERAEILPNDRTFLVFEAWMTDMWVGLSFKSMEWVFSINVARWKQGFRQHDHHTSISQTRSGQCVLRYFVEFLWKALNLSQSYWCMILYVWIHMSSSYIGTLEKYRLANSIFEKLDNDGVCLLEVRCCGPNKHQIR